MKKAKRILVGVKTVEQAVALTDTACRLGSAEACLVVVHVIEMPEPAELDAEVPDLEATGREILKAAARVARGGGREVETRVLRARNTGTALLDEMRSVKADLAVIGYHHRRTLGEILLGTTAQQVARHAPCEVVCLIPPRSRGKGRR